MPSRLKRALELPLSRKAQYLRFKLARLRMTCLYRWRLRGCGRDSIVLRPLFWTPEFVSIGHGVLIWTGGRIEGIPLQDGASGGPHIIFGDGVSVQQNCHVTAGGTIEIGAGSTVLSDVMITDLDHSYEQYGRRIVDQPLVHRPTRLGPNCFIGSGARILAGTTLGEHCVVGANAVVRGDFPSGSVIAGIPGRIIRQYDPATQRWERIERSGQA